MKTSHSWQYRDQVTPARVCNSLRIGEITSSDLLLLWAVNSLVRPQGQEDGIGCFATNKGLAEIIGANEKYISGRITELYNKGMLLIINLDGRRYLEAEWSRTLEERVALKGEYGKELRREHKKLQERLQRKKGGSGKPEPEGVQENLKGGSGKPEPEGSGKPEAHLNSLVLKSKRGCSRPARTSHTHDGFTDRHGKPTTKGKNAESEEHTRAARLLRDGLRNENQPITRYNEKKWTEHFRLLAEQDECDYLPVLEWYIEHCSYSERKRLNLPAINTAEQFRKVFGWIHNIYEKDQNDDGLSNEDRRRREKGLLIDRDCW